MKFLLLILLFPVACMAQPKIYLEATSKITSSDRDTLTVTGCDPSCGSFTNWVFTKVAGPNVAIYWGPDVPTRAIVAGLIAGDYIFRVDVKTAKGLSLSDTTAIHFGPSGSIIPPPVVVTSPKIIHDTVWIKLPPIITNVYIHDTTYIKLPVVYVHDTIAAKVIRSTIFFDNGTNQTK